jgi:hypothetical protein
MKTQRIRLRILFKSRAVYNITLEQHGKSCICLKIIKTGGQESKKILAGLQEHKRERSSVASQRAWC